MKGCRTIWPPCASSHIKRLTKNSSSTLLLTPLPAIWRRKNACVHALQKLRKSYWAGGARTVKRYRKTNGAQQLLAASRVGGVITTLEPIVFLEVELMRKRILADYERDVFSGEVCLHPGQEHSKVRGTERLGFAMLDVYPNAKPKSVKPIRLVGERARAEQEIGEDLLARGGIELYTASEWAPNGFLVSKKEKGKWRLVVDYCELN